MQATSQNNLSELRTIIKSMTLEFCYLNVLPEFGIHWSEVSRAVRKSRLPMFPSSIASVLSKHAAKTMTESELFDIISRIRLKSIIHQHRTWHMIELKNKTDDKSSNIPIADVASHIFQAVKSSRRNDNKKPEVQTLKIGDLLYISIQLSLKFKPMSVLYVATPPGEPVAFVSSLHSSLLKPCVQGLGYEKFEDGSLNGKNIHSLLTIYNNNQNAVTVADLPEYSVVPLITSDGIDFTGTESDKAYVDAVLGPNPPLLEKLTLTTKRGAFHQRFLNSSEFKMNLCLKSKNVAESLKTLAETRVIEPTSKLFHVFHSIKSNVVVLCDEENDNND